MLKWGWAPNKNPRYWGYYDDNLFGLGIPQFQVKTNGCKWIVQAAKDWV